MTSVTGRSTTVKLSYLLNSVPNFSFFDELINITAPNQRLLVQLLQHDIFKINKILDDIILYLNDLVSTANKISQVSRDIDEMLPWYLEGKLSVIDLLRNLDSIDSIISRLLFLLENQDYDTDGDPHIQVNQSLIRKFEESSDLLLDVKKSLIMLKKNLDIAINYHELMDMVIKSLKDEIEDCLNIVVQLRSYKLTSPRKVLPKFSLNAIVSKMQVHNFTSGMFISNSTNSASNSNTIISATTSTPQSPSVSKSIKLPTFNDLDEKIYEEYLLLEEKVSPLNISLDIVPSKIEEFNTLCSHSAFIVSKEKVLLAYETMLDKWHFLKGQMKIMKHESIDLTWNEVFNYLVAETTHECGKLIELFGHLDTAKSAEALSLAGDEIGDKYKACSNSIQLTQKAIQENIITDDSIVAQFYETLQPRWMEVNELITQSKAKTESIESSTRTIELPKRNTSSGLRPFQIGSRNSSLNNERPISNGLGIDFNVDVETVTIPLSVQKKDKVIDFFQKNIKIKHKNKNNAFHQINNFNNSDEDDNDEENDGDNGGDDNNHNADHEQDVKPQGKNLKSTLVDAFDALKIDNKDIEERTLVSSPPAPSNVADAKLNRERCATFDANVYFENILNSSVRKPSGLPRISKNYIQHGYPIITKRRGYTKIPEINASHPVFQSPYKQRGRSRGSSQSQIQGQRQGQSQNHSPHSTNHHHIIQNDIRSSPYSRQNNPFRDYSSRIGSTATVIGRPNSLLNEMNIPNLTYSRRLSYNSTSPERPPSSLGSRYDDENLLRALSESRPIWK